MRLKNWVIFLSLSVLLYGCSKEKPIKPTALDSIKSELRNGVISDVDKNARNKAAIVLPNSVKDLMTPAFSSTNINIPKAEKLPVEKFDIVAENVPIRSFFLGLVSGTKRNIVVHPDLTEDITLSMRNVTIYDVLDSLQQLYGFNYEETSAGFKISPNDLETKIFYINYLDMARIGTSETRVSSSGLDARKSSNSSSSESSSDSSSSQSDSNNSSKNSKVETTYKADFWAELKESLESIIGTEDGRKVVVSSLIGQVVVRAYPNELIKVEKFLQRSTDTLNRQVIIEAKILEVELNDTYRSGINWGLINRYLRVAQLGGDTNIADDFGANLPDSMSTAIGNPAQVSVQSTGEIPDTAQFTNPFGGVLSLGLQYKKFAGFLELLGAQGNVQVLSSPRIVTTNNQKALIKVGSDAFFVTNVTTNNTTTGSSVQTSPTVDFDSFFSGIALDVTPSIDEHGYIILHIHPTISEVTTDTKNLTISGQQQSFPLAKSTVRESDSIIRAKNGELVVIGGLMQDSNEEAVVGVPYLMDVPFLGKAFRHTKQKARKSELVVLLRPVIITAEQNNENLENAYKRMNKLDRGFHMGGKKALFGTEGETW